MDVNHPRYPFDDPDAPVSEEERAAAAALRDALDNPGEASEEAELARALALAHAPRELDPKAHAAIVERALTRATPRGRVLRVSFAASGVLALAAAAVLVLGQLDARRARHANLQAPAAESTVTALPALVPLRSTQGLFSEPFAQPARDGASTQTTSAASERIDRIAMAREADLRENRFAMWGVR